MKKIICLTLMLVASFTLALGLTACNNDTAKTYKITLNANNTQTEISVVDGKDYTLESPTKTGYSFDGWFDEENNEIASEGKWTYGDLKNLYAKFNAKTYTVSLNANGGTLQNSTYTATYDSAYEIPTPTAPKGYAFAGWKKGGEDFAISGTWNLDSAVSLVASYSANSYEVNYVSTIGTLSKTTENVAYDSQIVFAEITGYDTTDYEFKGWKVNDSDVVLTTAPSKWNYDAKTTLTSQFDRIVYTINFAEMGSSQEPITGHKGDVKNLPTPTKTGYIFAGYSYQGATANYTASTWTISGNITLTAMWTAKTTAITLNAGEGTLANNSYTATYGATYVIPTPTAPKGYEFAGWKNGEDDFAISGTWDKELETLSLTAKYTAKTYNITLDAGKGSVDNNSYTAIYGKAYEIPTPTAPKGYTFAGWKKGEDDFAISGTWNLDEVFTLVAVYNAKTTAITLNAGEGTLANNSYVATYGTTYNLPAPTAPKGYEFAGWKNGEDDFAISGTWDKEIETLSLTAKYDAKTYKISLNANGGTLTDNSYTATYGKAYEIPAPTAPKGYTFAGWKKGEDDFAISGTWNLDEVFTLVASYSANSYEVVYVSAFGTLSKETENVKYDSKITFAEITGYDVEEYKFVGWKVNDTDVVLTEAPEKWTYDYKVTLTAQFDIPTYTITFVGIEQEPIVGYKGVEKDLPQPTKVGYTFKGYTYEGATENYTASTWVIKGDITLTAVWSANEIIVKFNTDVEGVTIEQVVMHYGDDYVLPYPEDMSTLVKDEHNFLGWSYNGEIVDKEGKLLIDASEITLTAKWQHKRFDDNWTEVEG